ncbi:MAG: M28 family peptidase [Acidobacteria bacterium]|nr:M28 family peptidase [Acidobacteriota bacterium]
MRFSTHLVKPLLCIIIAVTFSLPSVAAQKKPRLKSAPVKKAATAPYTQSLLDKISANSLRGHLSFIASDLLEGRGTPSRGLDLAAEYIAAQFRRAGLEPAGDDGYFQTADWNTLKATGRNPNPPQSQAQTALDAPPVKVRNVIGLLRGSDPKLKDTYILITAHYDHLGIRENLEGDKIFNGANDDGSGTVSVLELAAAFAAMKERPKRSLVFITFFGEERGLVGSRYYGAHPIFPIEQTVADINLEQLGRTDDTEGAQIKTAAVTGFDFSDVGLVLQKAGAMTGVKIFKHPTNSDRYFGASDNQALADQGVPAHTISVAYVYPDYHKVGDHWDKIDYDNMATIDRTVALAIALLANNPQAPRWNEANPKAARYVQAWKEHHGK